MLGEVTPVGETAKININTDETEEKDVAIQMLAVFIDELEGTYFDYIEPTSKILLPLVSYQMNESIRTSVAGCLPGLVKCATAANPGNREFIVGMGKTFAEALLEAAKQETETECLTAQVQALKDTIDEVGAGFFTDEAQINGLA